MKVKLGPFSKKAKPRKIKVQIDKWDTWSMDETIAHILVPLLKQLKATKQGIPGDFVEGDQNSEKEIEAGEARWNAVLDKMIWAFEQCLTDYMAEFFSGESDIVFEKITKGKFKGGSEMKTGPKDTLVFDKKGYEAHEARMQEGFDLFGKYFRNLWT